MEKNMNSEKIKMYISWRDDFLKIIVDRWCKECTDPVKETKNIDYEKPLNCECRCPQVENMITTAQNIDADIKLLS